jgi:hypothetical protein
MAARLKRAADHESGPSWTGRFFRAREIRVARSVGWPARHNSNVMALLGQRGN